MSPEAPQTVVLLPLDDRPVNTSQVASLAAAAGVRLLLPPVGVLPPGGRPSSTALTSRWLTTAASESDAVIVSVNQLVHGGYVSSRRTTESIDDWLPRLDALTRLRQDAPGRPIFGFVVLMRTKPTDDAAAEPHYWGQHGRDLFVLSRELWRAEHGVASDVDGARAAIPPEHTGDFLRRRLALHQLHLRCLDLAAAGVFDYLSVTVEDSTPDSVSTSEREWLQTWIRRLDVGERAACYPGADEAASVLLARALGVGRRSAPKVAVVCAEPAGLERIAPFEDVPVHQTLAAQITAAGASLCGDLLGRTEPPPDADLVVAVHPPQHEARLDAAHTASKSDPSQLVAVVAKLAAAGRLVSVADLAYPNGSDPVLVEALIEKELLTPLAGYAGWNTAGNSLGSAIAQGCVALARGDISVIRPIVAHRLIEDYGYQTLARASLGGGPLPPDVDGRVNPQLAQLLQRLPGLGSQFQIAPGTVRLPWDRRFEVDFALERTARADV